MIERPSAMKASREDQADRRGPSPPSALAAIRSGRHRPTSPTKVSSLAIAERAHAEVDELDDRIAVPRAWRKMFSGLMSRCTTGMSFVAAAEGPEKLARDPKATRRDAVDRAEDVAHRAAVEELHDVIGVPSGELVLIEYADDIWMIELRQNIDPVEEAGRVGPRAW